MWASAWRALIPASSAASASSPASGPPRRLSASASSLRPGWPPPSLREARKPGVRPPAPAFVRKCACWGSPGAVGDVLVHDGTRCVGPPSLHSAKAADMRTSSPRLRRGRRHAVARPCRRPRAIRYRVVGVWLQPSAVHRPKTRGVYARPRRRAKRLSLAGCPSRCTNAKRRLPRFGVGLVDRCEALVTRRRLRIARRMPRAHLSPNPSRSPDAPSRTHLRLIARRMPPHPRRRRCAKRWLPICGAAVRLRVPTAGVRCLHGSPGKRGAFAFRTRLAGERVRTDALGKYMAHSSSSRRSTNVTNVKFTAVDERYER